MMGLEPTTTGITIQYSNQLSYIHQEGRPNIESLPDLATGQSDLPRHCARIARPRSISAGVEDVKFSRNQSRPPPPAWKEPPSAKATPAMVVMNTLAVTIVPSHFFPFTFY